MKFNFKGQSISSGCSSNPSSTSTILDYESSSEEDRLPSLNEHMIKEALGSNVELNSHLQSLYVLYGNRSLLAVTAPDHSPDQLANSLVSCLATTHGIALQRRPLPYTTQLTVRTPTTTVDSTPSLGGGGGGTIDSLVLVGEITDQQLAVVAADKSDALKLIEAKTGLRLKKIKKNVYFAGLLFQFVLLNKLMSDRVRESAMAAVMSDKVNKKESGKWLEHKFYYAFYIKHSIRL